MSDFISRPNEFETAYPIKQIIAIVIESPVPMIAANPPPMAAPVAWSADVWPTDPAILPAIIASTGIITSHSAAPSKKPRENTLDVVRTPRSSSHVEAIHPRKNETSGMAMDGVPCGEMMSIATIM